MTAASGERVGSLSCARVAVCGLRPLAAAFSSGCTTSQMFWRCGVNVHITLGTLLLLENSC